jgi:RND family efflux transporter MFP subunit
MNLHPSLALTAAALALIQTACKPTASSDAAPTYNVRYIVAEPQTNDQTSGPAFLGLIRGDAETQLSFKVNGQISRIGPESASEDWKQGTQVRAGEVLAQLDTANFVNAVAAARAPRARRANYAATASSTPRKSLEERLRTPTGQKEMAEAELAQAEQYLHDTTLRAPYDGVILTRLARAGEFAAAGHPVILMGDFRRVSLEVGVPDTALPTLQIGQTRDVLISAFEGQSFQGTISEIGIAADPASRLFRVVLKIDNADGRLKSGMTARVNLGAAAPQQSRGILLPLSSLVASGTATGHSAVFVVDDQGQVHLRKLETSEIVGSSVLVTGGLQPGEKVVTLGAGLLIDGMQVQAQPQSR